MVKKNKKIRVAVLMGGPSSEHKVSLWTGQNVLKKLDKKKYDAKPIVISRDGLWPIKHKELLENFDLAFIAMHGEYGEDGQLQKILEKIKLPFTGSNSRVSKLTIDKAKFNALLKKNKINCPDFISLDKKSTRTNWQKLAKFELPLVVKPANLGSSVGISIVKTCGQLAPALKRAFDHSSKIMVEKYIPGRELTCGILKIKNKYMPLPPTEIILKTRPFFDFKAKYTPKEALEITPPRLPKQTIKQIQNLALKVFQTAKCSGCARIDIILGNDEQMYVLEINTLPGLTKTSLLPQAAKKAGITFPRLLDIIISNARRN